MPTVQVVAPAKVNLFLGIGGVRSDGYHDVTTVLHALLLHDKLAMVAVPEGSYDPLFQSGVNESLPTVEEQGLQICIEWQMCEGIEEPDVALEDNLVVKAILALARAYDFPWKGYMRVVIEKHIPFQAGLGGGSTDAAAALRGAAQLWGLPVSEEELATIAAGLGADVPFFLQGGCALFDDRGDRFVHELVPRKDYVVLISPQEGVSSSAAYRAFDEDPGAIPTDTLSVATEVQNAHDVPLFNNLAPASERLVPKLATIREWALEQPGVTGALLSGSGDVTFVVCENHEAAMQIAVSVRELDCWVRTTHFAPIAAQIVPNSPYGY